MDSSIAFGKRDHLHYMGWALKSFGLGSVQLSSAQKMMSRNMKKVVTVRSEQQARCFGGEDPKPEVTKIPVKMESGGAMRSWRRWH